jgi:methylphosphotriester-DNA--protein-cysteine methyltransferase
LSAVVSFTQGQPQERSTARLESARATGFRRCNPDGPSIECENAALVAKACRIIEGSDEEHSLEELADAIGRSPAISTACSRPQSG